MSEAKCYTERIYNISNLWIKLLATTKKNHEANFIRDHSYKEKAKAESDRHRNWESSVGFPETGGNLRVNSMTESFISSVSKQHYPEAALHTHTYCA